jgi:hypothetical protein
VVDVEWALNVFDNEDARGIILRAVVAVENLMPTSAPASDIDWLKRAPAFSLVKLLKGAIFHGDRLIYGLIHSVMNAAGL